MSDLERKRKSGWEKISEDLESRIFQFANEYMNYINQAKTEREIVALSEKIVRENGFKSLDEYTELHPGDKVYFVNRGKSLYLAVIGTKSMEEGLNIIGAHADSPRLDLKPNPLVQEGEFAYFKTHYYGGIKKYQ